MNGLMDKNVELGLYHSDMYDVMYSDSSYLTFKTYLISTSLHHKNVPNTQYVKVVVTGYRS